MSVKRDALYTAVAGKAIERGLDATVMDGHVLIDYGEKLDDGTDHLHKQVIRNLVNRLTPDATCHLNSTEMGFKVTVDFPQPRPAPSPDNDDWVSGLSDREKLDLIRRLVAA